MQTQQILNDRYQLQRMLGDNFNRQTWLAEDLETSELVVVKCLVLGEGRSDQWTYLKLFEREAQVLQQLDHDYIPQYRDYFPISDRTLWFALVEEYIPGDSLAQLLEQGKKFTEDQVYEVAIAILEILIYLHELNPSVLHRDIKPSNLIWHQLSEEENPEIYLVDFGAVQDKANAEGKTITVVGTYGYAPMEQFGGRAVAASDLYALGATLIHLLTGISPADLPQNDLRIDFSDRTSASKKLVQWIENLTEPDVKRRPQNARGALDLLENDNPNNLNLLPDRKIEQPQGSKIEIYSKSEELEIKIPCYNSATSQGFRHGLLSGILAILGYSVVTAFAFLLLWGLSFSILFIPVLIVFVPLFLIASRKLFENSFGYQLIRFNHNQLPYPNGFSIENRLFQFNYANIHGKISQIRDVFPSVRVNNHDREFNMIMIQTERKRYTFGVDLSAAECRWLVREIKEWLDKTKHN